VVRIGVDTPHKEEAERCLREAFPHAHNLYKICDPWESSYQPGMRETELKRSCSSKPVQQCQTALSPSTRIGCGGKFFLFSGAFINSEQGLAVAHATAPGKEITLESNQASSDAGRTIGECLETYDNLQRRSGEKLSADLALLKVNSSLVDNTVRWPITSGRTLRIKLYKEEQKVSDDTGVMIVDQNGKFQYGHIHRDHFTDENNKLHNVLAISAVRGEKEVSITQIGDSGALVTSHPRKDDEVVYVYGIVTGIYTDPKPTNVRQSATPEWRNTESRYGITGGSYTIANSLWEVIHELCNNSNYRTDLRNDNKPDDIDFV